MKKSIIKTSQAPAPIGPYNQAVRAGDWLFVSGQIAIDPVSGNIINDSIASETLQVMHNLQAILTEAGVGFEKVVKTTIYITSMDFFAEVNEVYGTFFSNDFPARETVAVSGLPKNVRVEISMIAIA